MKKKVIQTKLAPQAIGPYSQAVAVGDYLFCSGQIALNPETGELVGADAATQAGQALANLMQVLKAAGMQAKNVVKATLYLKDLDDFKAVNAVWAEVFTIDPPARATVEVSRLPAGALVEVDVIAAR